ncbi:MAG TPA: hypothetical protein VG269_18660 [Tepidisphaeraceae bacterium]|nr:hypothetical protein [Tepidisphaeraceae bacterium]
MSIVASFSIFGLNSARIPRGFTVEYPDAEGVCLDFGLPNGKPEAIRAVNENAGGVKKEGGNLLRGIPADSESLAWRGEHSKILQLFTTP